MRRRKKWFTFRTIWALLQNGRFGSGGRSRLPATEKWFTCRTVCGFLHRRPFCSGGEPLFLASTERGSLPERFRRFCQRTSFAREWKHFLGAPKKGIRGGFPRRDSKIARDSQEPRLSQCPNCPSPPDGSIGQGATPKGNAPRLRWELAAQPGGHPPLWDTVNGPCPARSGAKSAVDKNASRPGGAH